MDIRAAFLVSSPRTRAANAAFPSSWFLNPLQLTVTEPDIRRRISAITPVTVGTVLCHMHEDLSVPILRECTVERSASAA
jgi:hypothetical protein